MKTLLHLILLLIGIFLIYLKIPIGDYCWGLAHGIPFFLVSLLLFVLFLIITINDFAKYRIDKQKIDYIPVLIVSTTFLFNLFLENLDNKKFWTTIKLKAEVEQQSSRNFGILILYSNNTFETRCKKTDYTCTYTGTYTITNDTLNLNRENLSIITDSLFTNTYSIYKETLQPKNKKFKSIKIYNTANLIIN